MLEEKLPKDHRLKTKYLKFLFTQSKEEATKDNNETGEDVKRNETV